MIVMEKEERIYFEDQLENIASERYGDEPRVETPVAPGRVDEGKRKVNYIRGSEFGASLTRSLGYVIGAGIMLDVGVKVLVEICGAPGDEMMALAATGAVMLEMGRSALDRYNTKL
jgi:hypothetical protein